MSEIVLALERLDQLLPVLVRTDDDGAAVKPALARPASYHRTEQHSPGNQPGQTDEEECRQPQPRHFVAELGEKRGADEQQKHEGPG